MTNHRPSILIVEDEIRAVDALKIVLEDDYEIWSAPDSGKALQIFEKQVIDLVLIDIRLKGEDDGFSLLQKFKAKEPEISVVMVTAMDNTSFAVKAMKMGALDYIVKPFDPEELLVVVQKALKNNQVMQEMNGFRTQICESSFPQMIGYTPGMKQVFDLIRKVSTIDTTVLILGESGTGKEIVAKAIHNSGSRSQKPMISLNCAGIPDHLLEVELFGFEKGAFTGAYERKLGKFELSHGGTLFLDEIASMKLDLQAKLLRVLQQKEFERVGGVKTIRVDTRIIAASNQDLKKEVERNTFREDLYHRLNVIPIHLPPLRKRQEDVPHLAKYFLDKFNKKLNRKIEGISDKALDFFQNYSWPGNVRELENLMERMIVLAERNEIGVTDLPIEMLSQKQSPMASMMEESILFSDARDKFERDFITSVLEKMNWNQTQAAEVMGIHRNTLIGKSEKLGIKRKEIREEQ